MSMSNCTLVCEADGKVAHLMFEKSLIIYKWKCKEGSDVWGVENGTAPSKLFNMGSEDVELSDLTILSFDAPLSLGSKGSGQRVGGLGSFPDSFAWECTEFSA